MHYSGTIRASASKTTWGRTSTPQVGLYHVQGDGVGTQSPTWTTPISGHGQQFDICFPSWHQTHTHLQRHGMHAHKLSVMTTQFPPWNLYSSNGLILTIPGCSDYNIELISNLAPSTNRVAPIANNRILNNSLLTSNFYSLYLFV